MKTKFKVLDKEKFFGGEAKGDGSAVQGEVTELGGRKINFSKQIVCISVVGEEGNFYSINKNKELPAAGVQANTYIVDKPEGWSRDKWLVSLHINHIIEVLDHELLQKIKNQVWLVEQGLQIATPAAARATLASPSAASSASHASSSSSSYSSSASAANSSAVSINRQGAGEFENTKAGLIAQIQELTIQVMDARNKSVGLTVLGSAQKAAIRTETASTYERDNAIKDDVNLPIQECIRRRTAIITRLQGDLRALQAELSPLQPAAVAVSEHKSAVQPAAAQQEHEEDEKAENSVPRESCCSMAGIRKRLGTAAGATREIARGLVSTTLVLGNAAMNVARNHEGVPISSVLAFKIANGLQKLFTQEDMHKFGDTGNMVGSFLVTASTLVVVQGFNMLTEKKAVVVLPVDLQSIHVQGSGPSSAVISSSSARPAKKGRGDAEQPLLAENNDGAQAVNVVVLQGDGCCGGNCSCASCCAGLVTGTAKLFVGPVWKSGALALASLVGMHFIPGAALFKPGLASLVAGSAAAFTVDEQVANVSKTLGKSKTQ